MEPLICTESFAYCNYVFHKIVLSRNCLRIKHPIMGLRVKPNTDGERISAKTESCYAAGPIMVQSPTQAASLDVLSDVIWPVIYRTSSARAGTIYPILRNSTVY